MNLRKVSLAARLSMAVGMVLTAAVANATPAFATDDTFTIGTGQCPSGPDAGFGMFRDYGEGAPGGGNNDDYILIIDNCPDGKAVAVYAWEGGHYYGGKVNGNGAGTELVWDPFGNVEAGHTVGLKVCLWTRASGPFTCTSFTKTITDG